MVVCNDMMFSSSPGSPWGCEITEGKRPIVLIHASASWPCLWTPILSGVWGSLAPRDVCTAFCEPLGPRAHASPGRADGKIKFSISPTRRSCFIVSRGGSVLLRNKSCAVWMSCKGLIKLGAGGRISGLEKRQHCPKPERLAKDIWTMKRCRCNEVMLQAKGDLEKLIRNAGGGR